MIIRGKYDALTVAVVGVLARPKSPVNDKYYLKN
jgi:hypothetical protein